MTRPDVREAGESVVVVLGLPSKWLWPNNMPSSRGAKRRRDALAAEARASAGWKFLDATNNRRPMWGAATAEAAFYFKDRRPHDQDGANAAIKHHLDGAADAGLIVNDRWLTPLPPVLTVDRANPRLEIKITRKDAPPCP